MRPLRLVMEGFASFRQRTEINFEDADLFVLTGPTGAGKSSIIDAITFALYGLISRYDSQQSASPVITQGELAAKVSLDFSVGLERYTIARTLPVQGQHKVSLEHGPTTLAATVTTVKEEIVGILGLTFEEFTRCVVLPQGDFADFLHAGGSERRKLLTKLLDVGLYGRVHDLAAKRETVAKAEAMHLEALTNELADATPERLRATQRRLELIRKLCTRLEEDQDTLAALDHEAKEHQARRAALANEASQLAKLKAPAGLGELVARLASAEADAEQTRKAAEDAHATDDAAEASLAALPARSELDGEIHTHEEMAKLARQLEEAQRAAAALTKRHDGAVAALDSADSALDSARGEYERILRGDAAYHASLGLGPGDSCPVCGGVLATAPTVAVPHGLAEAKDRLVRAEGGRKEAQVSEAAAAKALATHSGNLEQIEARHGELTAAVAKARTLDEARQQLALVLEAIERRDATRRASAAAYRASNEAAEALKRLAGDREAATTALSAAWGPFAAAGAPAPAGGDVALDWRHLEEWAMSAARQREQEASDLDVKVAALASERKLRLDQQAEACETLGVAVGDRLPHTAAVHASGQLEQEVQAIADAVDKREQTEAKLKEAKAVRDLAGTVAKHFQHGNAGFEAWLLNSAMVDLCEIASRWLKELSSGAYSLTADDGGELIVIDHGNADTVRPVKTLSGGETFLASLSLALALSEQVAQVSPQGAAHLESLFLDEGFGTLDPETLEVVRDAVQELRSTGRMVGIITHVRELAEQIPVQFRVTKDARSSHVERLAD